MVDPVDTIQKHNGSLSIAKLYGWTSWHDRSAMEALGLVGSMVDLVDTIWKRIGI